MFNSRSFRCVGSCFFAIEKVRTMLAFRSSCSVLRMPFFFNDRQFRYDHVHCWCSWGCHDFWNDGYQVPLILVDVSRIQGDLMLGSPKGLQQTVRQRDRSTTNKSGMQQQNMKATDIKKIILWKKEFSCITPPPYLIWPHYKLWRKEWVFQPNKKINSKNCLEKSTGKPHIFTSLGFRRQKKWILA